ncbi:MAG: hydroxypyruvate isomerase [Microbacterium sp.]|nr:MAG: hydroxypyruvate isomerase [Microbacterium sp.]
MSRYSIINPSILIGDLPLDEQLRTVRAEGFTAVELWWPFAVPDPRASEVDAFLRTLDASGLDLVVFNSYEGGMSEGNRGIACWAGVDREFDASIEVSARIVTETGATGVNVLHGVRRGDEPHDVQDDRAAQRTARAAARLAETGAVVTIEQLSHIPGYALRTIDDVKTALARARSYASSGEILIQVDLFHMFQVGDDVARFFTEDWRDIGHVQVADVPGRGGPGTGAQPIDDLLDLLLAQGYERRIALEYSHYEGDDPFGWMR